MNFCVIPPEVNSGLLYSAPDSRRAAATAVAWDAIAIDLLSTADSYHPVIFEMIVTWPGPWAIGIAGAATRYAHQIRLMAIGAAYEGAKSRASAVASKMAHAMAVPPLVIATNRAWFATLVAANQFGETVQAVAATEAQYLEMWAQDASVMGFYLAAWRFALGLSACRDVGGASASSTHSAGNEELAASAPLGTETCWALAALLSAEWFPKALNTNRPANDAERLALRPVGMLTQAAQVCPMAAGGLMSYRGALPSDPDARALGISQLMVRELADRVQAPHAAVTAQVGRAQSLCGMSVPPRWPAPAGDILQSPTSERPSNSGAPTLLADYARPREAGAAT